MMLIADSGTMACPEQESAGCLGTLGQTVLQAKNKMAIAITPMTTHFGCLATLLATFAITSGSFSSTLAIRRVVPADFITVTDLSTNSSLGLVKADGVHMHRVGIAERSR